MWVPHAFSYIFPLSLWYYVVSKCSCAKYIYTQVNTALKTEGQSNDSHIGRLSDHTLHTQKAFLHLPTLDLKLVEIKPGALNSFKKNKNHVDIWPARTPTMVISPTRPRVKTSHSLILFARLLLKKKNAQTCLKTLDMRVAQDRQNPCTVVNVTGRRGFATWRLPHFFIFF